MRDHNEAMRLADSVHEMNNAAYMTAIANLNEKNRQQAERIAELEAEVLEQARLNGMGAERELALMAERDQHQATATALIALLADIRKACGDDGKRMQPELVEFIGAMKADRDHFRADVERLRESCAVISWNHYMDTCKRLGVSASENYAWCSAKSIRDAARTTHKETE